MWNKFFSFWAIFCVVITTWGANLPPNEDPKADPKKDDCCAENTNPDCNGCVNYQFLFGKSTNDPSVPKGNFSIYTLRPSQNLFSPFNLYYYHPLFTQIISDETKDNHKIIKIQGRNREAETFAIRNGDSLGYPTGNYRTKLNKSIVMLDKDEQPVNSTPEFYRVFNQDGSSVTYQITPVLTNF